jgi:hypothetical protein
MVRMSFNMVELFPLTRQQQLTGQREEVLQAHKARNNTSSMYC